MSGNASGTGDHTVSDVNATRLPQGQGEESQANNVTTTGGGHSGPAKHTSGKHTSDWKNVLDPRYDANSNTAAVRAEAQAQAKAEAEREQQAGIQVARAEERGDVEAQRQAERERSEAEKAEEAARARFEGREEAAREAAQRGEEEKARAVDATRREAESQAEAQRRAEEEARLNKKGGIRDGLKSIAKTAHGAGETFRGRVNATVDERAGHNESAAAHRETARAGEHNIGLNKP